MPDLSRPETTESKDVPMGEPTEARKLGYGGLRYTELKPGDVVDIRVLVADHIGWEWERREVVSVDFSREFIVRFRDPSDGREYDIDVRDPKERGRGIRPWEPMGYCSRCGSPMMLHFYPRPGPAPGNMKVCTD